MKDIQKNVENVLRPPQKRPRIQADDASLAAFFGQVAKLPNPRQIQARADLAARAKNSRR